MSINALVYCIEIIEICSSGTRGRFSLKPIDVSNVLSVSIFSYFNTFPDREYNCEGTIAVSFLSRLLEVLVVSRLNFP